MNQATIIEAILRAHVEKRRFLFVHIPKCAGTDLSVILSARHPSIHHTVTDPAWLPPDRLEAKVAEIEAAMEQSPTVLVHGHVRLSWIVDEQLYRPGEGDRLFTVIREPVSLILSQVNYITGKILDDPTGEAVDTSGWMRTLGITDATDFEPVELAMRVLTSRVVHRECLCSVLGDGTALSAIDLVKRSGIEITAIDRYAEWLKERWGITSKSRHNMSRRIITQEVTASSVLESARALCVEDSKLYAVLIHELGNRAWIGGAY
jgi:hypothetical protein